MVPSRSGFDARPRSGVMGSRTGENHPRARFTEDEVCVIRELHEEQPVGHPGHWSYLRLAAKFECSKSVIRDICRYRTWKNPPWD